LDGTDSEADLEGPRSAADADRPAGDLPELAAGDKPDGSDPDDPSITLLDRLDRRQNQVLQQLDQLNARIEQLLEGFRRA
jgi:hypothetical protein